MKSKGVLYLVIMIVFSTNILSAQSENRDTTWSYRDSLANYSWSYLVDSTNALSLSEVIQKQDDFKKIGSDSLQINSEVTFWLALDSMPDHKANYLYFGDYDIIEAYHRDTSAGGWITEKNGRLIPPAERSHPTPPYAVQVPGTAEGNGPLFVKIKNYHFFENSLIQPEWLDEETYDQLGARQMEMRRSHTMLAGIMCGALLAFFIYPLILFLLNRRIFYLYYSLFILLSFFLYLFTFERYGHIDLLFSYYPPTSSSPAFSFTCWGRSCPSSI